MTTQNIGVDVGYGNTKAAYNGQTALFPSITGPAVRIGYRSDLSRNGHDDMVMEHAGERLFIGDLARRQSPSPRSPLGRERDMAFVQQLALAAIYAGGVRTGDVNLVTGLPVAWYEDHAALAAALQGEHTYTINDEPVQITIPAPHVIPQPFGTLYGQMIHDARVTDPHGYAHAIVAIVDIGDGTTDFVVSKGLEYIQPLSGSIDVAAAQIYEHVRRALQTEHSATYTRREVEVLIHSRQTLRIAGQDVDLAPLITAALDAVASRITDWMGEHWGNARQFEHLLVTGGGANLLAADVRHAYPFATRVDGPQMANVCGFEELAALRNRGK